MVHLLCAMEVVASFDGLRECSVGCIYCAVWEWSPLSMGCGGPLWCIYIVWYGSGRLFRWVAGVLCGASILCGMEVVASFDGLRERSVVHILCGMEVVASFDGLRERSVVHLFCGMEVVASFQGLRRSAQWCILRKVD